MAEQPRPKSQRPTKLPRRFRQRNRRQLPRTRQRPRLPQCRGKAAICTRNRSRLGSGPLRMADRRGGQIQPDLAGILARRRRRGGRYRRAAVRGCRQCSRTRSRRRDRRTAGAPRHLVGPLRAVARRRHGSEDTRRPRRAAGLRPGPHLRGISRLRRGAHRRRGGRSGRNWAGAGHGPAGSRCRHRGRRCAECRSGKRHRGKAPIRSGARCRR